MTNTSTMSNGQEFHKQKPLLRETTARNKTNMHTEFRTEKIKHSKVANVLEDDH